MHPLNKLFALNRGRGVFRAETAADEATIYLYDVIVDTDADAEWWGGVSVQTFARELAAISAPTIHLRINSPGGSVFAGRAMEQAVREHASRIVAHVDGYAASAATMPLMAADEIEIAPGGMVMIHKAWTLAMGNSDDLLQQAAMLEKIDGTLVQTYAARTKVDADLVAQWMASETWFTADEAVQHGFADRIASASPKASAIEWDLSAYGRAPKASIATHKPEQQPDPREALARRLAVAARI